MSTFGPAEPHTLKLRAAEGSEGEKQLIDFVPGRLLFCKRGIFENRFFTTAHEFFNGMTVCHYSA